MYRIAPWSHPIHLTLALIKNEKKNNPISSNQFNYRYGFIVRIEAKIRL